MSNPERNPPGFKYMIAFVITLLIGSFVAGYNKQWGLAQLLSQSGIYVIIGYLLGMRKRKTA
jgi:hypothetical protein